MAEFDWLTRFDQGVGASDPNSPWGMFVRRVLRTGSEDAPGLFKSLHDGAHGIDASRFDSLAVVQRINGIFEGAGISYRLTDQAQSNGTLPPGLSLEADLEGVIDGMRRDGSRAFVERNSGRVVAFQSAGAGRSPERLAAAKEH